MGCVSAVLGTIMEEGAAVQDEDLQWLPEGEDEVYLAREIGKCRTVVQAQSGGLGRLLTDVMNRCRNSDLEDKANLTERVKHLRRSIPDSIHIREIETFISELSVRDSSLVENTDNILGSARTLVGANTRLGILINQKNNFLRRQMGDLLAGDEGPRIRGLIDKVVISIQRCRKEQGQPLYPRDALIMLVYEIVYEAYLWRGQRRRGSGQYIFDEHLLAALDEAVRNGRTGLARLLTLIKHDSGEDLLIHQPNCEKHESLRDLKDDWFYCSDLYFGKLGIHPVPDGNGGEVVPFRQASAIIRASTSTIRGMTAPPMRRPADDTDWDLARFLADADKASHHFTEMLHRPHVASNKALEQCSNSGTLIGLGRTRGRQKWTRMIVPNAIVARSHSLKQAYVDLVGGGVDFFDTVDRRGIRAAYNRLQRERILQFLGVGNSTSRSSFLSRLSGLCGNHTPDDAVAVSSPGQFDEVMSEWGAVFEDCADRSNGIVAVQIIPTPLEEYVDLSRLHEPDYEPEIPEADPLFHVLVLVDNQEHIPATVDKTITATRPNLTSSFGSIPTYPDQASMGTLMYLEDDAFGGAVQVRVNATTDEARSRTGNMTSKNPIPEHIYDWLLQAQADTEQFGTPVLEAITRYVFRRTIAATTDTSTARKTVLLPQGSTGLDLAAHLPMTRWSHALVFGNGFRRRYPRASTTLNPGTARYSTYPDRLLAAVDDGDFALISHDEEPVSEVGLLARLACCEDPRASAMAARYFKESTFHDAVYGTDTTGQPGTQENPKRDEVNINRAVDYLRTVIGPVFGINDYEIITFACMHILGVDPIEDQRDPMVESQLSELRDVTIGRKYEIVEGVAASLDRRAMSLNMDIARSLARQNGRLAGSEFSSTKYLASRADVLRRIGNGNLDPMKVLALYFDRDQPLQLTFTAEQTQEGVLSDIYARAAAIGLSASPNQPGGVAEGGEATFTIEWDMSRCRATDHDLLRFILSFYDDDTVSSVRLSSGNIRFPACFREVSGLVNNWASTTPQSPTPSGLRNRFRMLVQPLLDLCQSSRKIAA